MGSAAKALSFGALLALASAGASAGQDFPQLSRVEHLPAAESHEIKTRSEDDGPADEAASAHLLSTLGALGLGLLGLLWIRRRSTHL
ncbi:MAG TPA: hypothetical protein VF210_07145 [Pseudomonadales bacterium]